nr:hypothetical protein [Paenibacillus xylanexedens]
MSIPRWWEAPGTNRSFDRSASTESISFPPQQRFIGETRID